MFHQTCVCNTKMTYKVGDKALKFLNFCRSQSLTPSTVAFQGDCKNIIIMKASNIVHTVFMGHMHNGRKLLFSEKDIAVLGPTCPSNFEISNYRQKRSSIRKYISSADMCDHLKRIPDNCSTNLSLHIQNFHKHQQFMFQG